MPMSSMSIEFNDTHGTTLIIISTPELVVFTSDSRATQSRSGRVVSDDETKYVEIITSTVYATGTGSSIVAGRLFKELQGKYGQIKSRDEPTVKEIAEYALKRVNEMEIPYGSSYAFIGVENGRPEAYTLDKSNPCQKSVGKVTGWWVGGIGLSHAEYVLGKEHNGGNLTEAAAIELSKRALSASSIKSPSTGGVIRVLVFNSKGLSSSETITSLDAYLTYYDQWEKHHSNTIYIFSRGRINDAALIRWFSSGCLIQQVNVTVVHAIGQVQGYHVHRVVLEDKDPSTIIEEVKNICDAYGCREETNEKFTKFPCLSILYEIFYFAQLSKEELREVCGFTS